MKQTIYVDVLICVNLFINYFLLLAVAKFLKIKFKRTRIIIASLFGSLYSLYILLPKVHILASFFTKTVISIVIIVCAFGPRSIKQLTKQFFCFYSINFAFCGTMFAIWYFIAPKNLIVKNGITYFNISPMMLVTTTLVSYTITRIIQKITGQEISSDLFCDIIIEQGGNIEKIRAKIDTGNDLKEPFSLLPVLIVEKGAVKKVVPDKENQNNFRIVPYHAVSGDGLLQAFKPDKTTIFKKDEHFDKEIYVALCDKGILPSEFDALASIEIAQR